MLVDAQGRQIGGNIRLRQVPPRGFSSLHSDDGIKGLTAGRAYTGDVGDGRRLTMIAETEPFDDSGTARLRSYLAGFGSILLVVGLGLVMFSRLVERRIGAMRATAAAIVDGDMQRRVPTEGDGGAFDAQAHAFNAMLDRIAELMRGIAEVSSDIAHDLRSPLAGCGPARPAWNGVPRRRRCATACPRRSRRATRSSACSLRFLRIAEVEGGARRAGFARFDLGESSDGGRRDDGAGGRGRCALSSSAIPSRAARPRRSPVADAGAGQSDRQCRAPYAAGTRITLSAVAARGQAIVRVADNGPGIAAADRATALRRFGRLDASRSTGGFGLGLPLAAAIARLHHGELSLEDAAPGSARGVERAADGVIDPDSTVAPAEAGASRSSCCAIARRSQPSLG